MKALILRIYKRGFHWGWFLFGISCMAMFATCPSTIMDAAFGRLHNSGVGAFGVHPTVLESIMVDGQAVNIAIQLIPNETHPQ